jgi:hypothetical protein
MVLHGTSSYASIRSFLEGRESLSSLLSKADSNADVQEAFFFLGASGNVWANLYKVSEIVEKSMGGRSSDLFRKNLCTRTEWNRFRRTANHQEATGVLSRHARTNQDPPLDPMAPDVAKLFIIELLKQWCNYLNPVIQLNP